MTSHRVLQSLCYLLAVIAMVILLIGSTGNGKSTLGNFLIDPGNSDHGPVFGVAVDNKPKTQFTKVATLPVTATKDIPKEVNDSLMIVDTPGLNESKSKDLAHMTALIECLNRMKKIRACIFVVKFLAKIDQQYKDTIRYYSELLPDIFKSNVLIVVMEFLTDNRSEATRKKQGIDAREMVNNITKEIVDTANISYTPTTFMIDCLPFDDDEMLLSLEERKNILLYILEQRDVMVENLRVSKTKAIKEDDERKVMIYKGKVEGYSLRLERANMKAAEAHKEIKEAKDRISSIEYTLSNTRRRVSILDTDEEVVSTSSSTDHEPEGWFMSLYTDFDLVSQWDISSINWWKFSSNNVWKNCIEERRRIRARLQGRKNGGLHGSITVYTKKKWMNEAEINQLRSEIKRKESDLAIARKDAQYFQEKCRECSEELETLEKLIEEAKEDIRKIDSSTMSLSEAQDQIREFNNY